MQSTFDWCAAIRPPASATLCSKGKTFQTMQIVFFPLAAIAGGVGVYLIATSGKSAPRTTNHGQPQVGPGGASSTSLPGDLRGDARGADAPHARVIAGRLGGRRLTAPRGLATRPTSDRVREALFSALGNVSGDLVLDLYAGTGALGIEALSRGAAAATFVESARGAPSGRRAPPEPGRAQGLGAARYTWSSPSRSRAPWPRLLAGKTVRSRLRRSSLRVPRGGPARASPRSTPGSGALACTRRRASSSSTPRATPRPRSPASRARPSRAPTWPATPASLYERRRAGLGWRGPVARVYQPAPRFRIVARRSLSWPRAPGSRPRKLPAPGILRNPWEVPLRARIFAASALGERSPRKSGAADSTSPAPSSWIAAAVALFSWKSCGAPATQQATVVTATVTAPTVEAPVALYAPPPPPKLEEEDAGVDAGKAARPKSTGSVAPRCPGGGE